MENVTAAAAPSDATATALPMKGCRAAIDRRLAC